MNISQRLTTPTHQSDTLEQKELPFIWQNFKYYRVTLLITSFWTIKLLEEGSRPEMTSIKLSEVYKTHLASCF